MQSIMSLQSDPALARDLLGWEARVDLESGIAATIEWLRTQPAPPSDPVRVQL